MDIDLLMLFGYDAIDRFKRNMINWMNSRLAVRASGSSTEEDQKAYTRLASCLTTEIEFSGSQIKCSTGIDRNKLTKEFLEKNGGLIDSVETEFNTGNQFFLQTMVTDEMELPDVESRMTEQIIPFLYTQLNNMFGGEASA